MRLPLKTLVDRRVHERRELNLLKILERMPPERRQYTLLRLAQHLCDAQEWSRLFEMLDRHQYGRAKLHYDPSTEAYALDLDLGRRAAIEAEETFEGALNQLPRLWS